MKALIYCRVSSERQAKEGHGIDSQEQRCRAYAKTKQYEVVEVFPDEGISGGLFERPAMKSLISYLDTHPLEKFVIIFDDLSRFARDVKVHIQLKAELLSREAKLECLNFSYDDSDESEMAELMLAVSNQYQRKANRRQVIQKQTARLENGYWTFTPPLGLRNERDPIHGKLLIPVEPYASIIKDTIEKYRDGVLPTLDEVKQYLHKRYKEEGVPNRPSLSTTVCMLKNPLYAGYLEHRGWKIQFMKAKHEGIISIQTYNLVQERLQGRTKPWKRKDYAIDFPLRPHVLCASCTKPMTASWNKGRNARYPYYFCRTDGCKYIWKVISKYKMESQFEDLLMQAKPLDEYLDLINDVMQEQWRIRLEKYNDRRVTLKAELDETVGAIKSYFTRIAKARDEELISAYEDEINELREKKKHYEISLSKRTYTSEEFGTATDKVLSALKEPMSMWKSDDYNDKRTILFMYFEEQLKYDYNLGFGTASLASPVNLINDMAHARNKSVELTGLEPVTSSMSMKRSSQLSYSSESD